MAAKRFDQKDYDLTFNKYEDRKFAEAESRFDINGDYSVYQYNCKMFSLGADWSRKYHMQRFDSTIRKLQELESQIHNIMIHDNSEELGIINKDQERRLKSVEMGLLRAINMVEGQVKEHLTDTVRMIQE